MTRWRYVAIIAVLALIATGCLRYEVETTIDDDGSGQLVFVLLVGPELQEPEGEFDSTSFDASMPPSAELSDVSDGDYVGRQAVIPFASLTELNDIAADLLVVEPDEEGTFDTFAVTKDGPDYAFDAAYRQVDTEGLEDEDLESLGTFEVRLQMPGSIVDHDADEVAGDLLTWRMPLEESRTLMARSRIETVSGFTDIAGNLHVDAIVWVVDAGIASGFPDSTYRPDAAVTRGQMATFLTHALDLPSGTATFSDIGGTAHEDAITAVAEAGIASGYEDGTFGPDDAVTRGQMATFLFNALGDG